ncbi:hypothetical protein GCM10022403_010490 [Streptomyces coacervatus]|uniref:Uncharacterized protein n=1 Tax=Streptomyces coacervatus TaxID=647381 RepID=A0ABP7GY79_9ACTN
MAPEEPRLLPERTEPDERRRLISLLHDHSSRAGFPTTSLTDGDPGAAGVLLVCPGFIGNPGQEAGAAIS